MNWGGMPIGFRFYVEDYSRETKERCWAHVLRALEYADLTEVSLNGGGLSPRAKSVYSRGWGKIYQSQPEKYHALEGGSGADGAVSALQAIDPGELYGAVCSYPAFGGCDHVWRDPPGSTGGGPVS